MHRTYSLFNKSLWNVQFHRSYLREQPQLAQICACFSNHKKLDFYFETGNIFLLLIYALSSLNCMLPIFSACGNSRKTTEVFVPNAPIHCSAAKAQNFSILLFSHSQRCPSCRTTCPPFFLLRLTFSSLSSI